MIRYEILKKYPKISHHNYQKDKCSLWHIFSILQSCRRYPLTQVCRGSLFIFKLDLMLLRRPDADM